MSDSQRLDKWLWHARVAKTRTLAASLVTSGHVRLNRARISKASQPVKPGDVLTVALRGRVLVLRIEAIAERRGPASEAATLYCDLSPPPPTPEETAPGSRPRGGGRPTKRDRRQIDAWKDDLRAPNDEEI
ncbi:RNA-binding S4 domain-containing protein [Microbaculum sp. FT89]|uniref:RNA-binding S4 domain-containing protein n=1 Tax=Microbaculum sp. FT89 TaxID=3447298 RepID=UPI003F53577E